MDFLKYGRRYSIELCGVRFRPKESYTAMQRVWIIDPDRPKSKPGFIIEAKPNAWKPNTHTFVVFRAHGRFIVRETDRDKGPSWAAYRKLEVPLDPNEHVLYDYVDSMDRSVCLELAEEFASFWMFADEVPNEQNQS